MIIATTVAITTMTKKVSDDKSQVREQIKLFLHFYF